jgi:hypothetical protein
MGRMTRDFRLLIHASSLRSNRLQFSAQEA